VIFDSVTPLLFQFDARYVLSFLATCKELANLGKTIIVSLHSYAINESLRLRADSIVDAHLRLRIEELGKQVVRTLEVSKIRGAVKTIGNSVSFTVEPGIGLKQSRSRRRRRRARCRTSHFRFPRATGLS